MSLAESTFSVTYEIDENVENNFEDDKVPDVLNPYIDQKPALIPAHKLLPMLTRTVSAPCSPVGKRASKIPHFKKKSFDLSVQTFAPVLLQFTAE
jgi:hypothetical protein